ncbi:MAG: DUF4926 domain-containing protein [Bacteroidetes bacterium]|nr:DUF4926 domain-containing protein [Bacteroidota bacterium]
MKSPPTDTLSVLDVVALTEDVPEHDLARGQVGTIVESLGPDVFEVEFTDDNGRAYALAALRRDQLLPLHFAPTASS